MVPLWIIVVGVLAVLLGCCWGVRNYVNSALGYDTGFFLADRIISNKSSKPVIWWYVDDGEANGRQWLDWGNRATREPNEPYLRVCLARARHLWTPTFDLQPVMGRAAAVELLGGKAPEGWQNCPPEIWMQWCRAAFLSRLGGLWLDGSVLPVGGAEDLKSRLAGHEVLTFGSDPIENIVGPKQTGPAAGSAAGWAVRPNQAVWNGLASDWSALIAEGPAAWSAPRARRGERWLWDKHCAGKVSIDRRAEVSRDRYGKRLELDTLLGASAWPSGTQDGGLWVPLPDGRTGLERATNWAWFCRLSAEQIAESDFLWAKWSTK